MGSRLVRFLAALLVLAMFAAACGGGSDSDEAASGDSDNADSSNADSSNADDDGDGDGDSGDEPAGDTVELIEDEDPDQGPVVGGTLRYGLEADVNGINPASSALSAPGLMMGNAVFDNLAVFNDADEWEPFLAESFTPNDDFTSWTMTLREGIKFHDGTDLNAAAIEVNFLTQFGDPLVGLAVRPFFVEEGPFEIIDDLTVQFNLSGPDANFPTSLTGALGMVASPAWLAATLEDPTLNQSPIGTGPFIFDSRSEDSVTRFVRNDDWWGGEVYLDAVEFVPVTDSAVRVDLLEAGELQALHSTNQASVIDVQENDTLQNVIDDSGEESFAMLNTASAPFDDVRARQALTFLTPRQDYIDLIGLGISQPADQMFTTSSPYYNPDVVQEADNPDAAMPLIEAYCADVPDSCTDGRIDIEFQWSGPSVVQTRIAELFEESWNPGFNVDFQELFQDAHIQEVAFGQYDVVTWRQFGAVNPGNDRVWLACSTISGISLNWPRLCDEERDAILDELQLATTVEERTPLLFELSEKLNQDYAYIFLTHTTWVNSFSEDVRGVCSHMTPAGSTRRCVMNGRTWFSNVWLAE